MSLVVPFEEIFANQTGLIASHESWARVELGEVSAILNGFPFKSALFNKSKGVPVVRIRDIAKGSPETFYNGEFPKEYIVRNGDLLIGMDGNFRCCEWQGGKVGLNQRVCKITPDEEILHPKFLFYGMNGYLKAIQDATSSVTVGHLSSRDVQRIPFPIPPLTEQRRIVAKLEKLLGKVDACEKRLAKIPVILKRFRQSILAAACSGRLTADWREKNPNVGAIRRVAQSGRGTASPLQNTGDDLPEGWMFSDLKNLCNGFQYGSSKKSLSAGKVPVLRMGNIQNGKLDWSNLVYTSDANEIKKYFLNSGDVLFNRTNSPELVGKTAIYRGERPAIFAGYLIRIRNKPEIDSEYLNFCLNTTFSRVWCQEVKTDGVSQSNINAQKLAAFSVPLPPLTEQQEIVRRVEALFALADQIEARYTKAKASVDKLTQSILAKAFRGELVPQDPNDEPANMLLARIRAEKASHVVSGKKKRRAKKTTEVKSCR